MVLEDYCSGLQVAILSSVIFNIYMKLLNDLGWVVTSVIRADPQEAVETLTNVWRQFWSRGWLINHSLILIGGNITGGWKVCPKILSVICSG